MFYDIMYYHIKLSNKCNKNCSYCFDDKDARGRVTVDDFKRLIDISSGYEKLHITMMGGEPLLFSHMMFEECFQYAVKTCNTRSQKLELKVITNGSKLDKFWIQLFRKYNVHVCVSYDGQNQEKSEYDKIKEFAEDIQTVNFTMNKDNYHIFSDTIRELDALGIPYIDGYIDIFSTDDLKPHYIQAFKDAFIMMDSTKHKIKWYLHRDLKRYAVANCTQNRNTQITGVFLNNDFSLRPGGVIMPSVQDSNTYDMTLGNIHGVDHIIDIIFSEKNLGYNKAYIKYMNNLTETQQLEKDLRGGYLFDKSTIGMPLEDNWDFMFDIYRELIEFLRTSNV